MELPTPTIVARLAPQQVSSTAQRMCEPRHTSRNRTLHNKRLRILRASCNRSPRPNFPRLREEGETMSPHPPLLATRKLVGKGMTISVTVACLIPSLSEARTEREFWKRSTRVLRPAASLLNKESKAARENTLPWRLLCEEGARAATTSSVLSRFQAVLSSTGFAERSVGVSR